jgi:spermidine synthase
MGPRWPPKPLATAAFLLPTIVMGALFSHLGTSARAAGIGFGRALGVNTLGAAVAPWLFGVVLVPGVGSKFALLLVAAGYLALSSRRAWFAMTQWITAGATAGAGLMGTVAGDRRMFPRAGGSSVSGRGDGARSAWWRTPAAWPAAHQQPPAGRQQRNPVRRRPPGAAASAAPPGAAARALPRPGHRHHGVFGRRRSQLLRSTRSNCCPKSSTPRPISRACSDRRGEPAPAPDDRRRKTLCATTRERYDLIVSDNFHPGPQRLRFALHRRAFQGRASAARRGRPVLPMAAAASARPRHPAQHRARTFSPSTRRARAMLATNSLDTPVLGLVARRDGERLRSARLRERLDRRGDAAPSPADFGLADDSRCRQLHRRSAQRWRVSPATRR